MLLFLLANQRFDFAKKLTPFWLVKSLLNLGREENKLGKRGGYQCALGTYSLSMTVVMCSCLKATIPTKCVSNYPDK